MHMFGWSRLFSHLAQMAASHPFGDIFSEAGPVEVFRDGVDRLIFTKVSCQWYSVEDVEDISDERARHYYSALGSKTI